MINMAGDIIGAVIRWLARRCKTNFQDELDCADGWFTNVPILGTFENIILSQCFVIIVIIIIAIILNN
jgi:hypothetical protein